MYSSSLSSTALNARLPIPDFEDLRATGGGSKTPNKRPGVVRKVKSFISAKDVLSSSSSGNGNGVTATVAGSGNSELPEGFMLVHSSTTTTPKVESPPIPLNASSNPARNSIDWSRVRPTSSIFSSSTSTPSSSTNSAANASQISASAASQAHMLKTRTLATLDPIKDLRKLRVLLRNESLGWIAEWVRYDGYCGLMDRLCEVLGKEWREEQHDDSVLGELLKCFRALLMTEVRVYCCSL